MPARRIPRITGGENVAGKASPRRAGPSYGPHTAPDRPLPRVARVGEARRHRLAQHWCAPLSTSIQTNVAAKDRELAQMDNKAERALEPDRPRPVPNAAHVARLRRREEGAGPHREPTAAC